MQIQQSIASIVSGEPPKIGTGLDVSPPGTNPSKRGDRIWRSPFPNWPQSAGAPGGVNAILSQIMTLLQQLLSAFGGTQTAQPFFNNAQASSTGDPHLAFNGATNAGTQQSRFDSMDDHPDLLDSSSFRGGFQIGTSVTAPAAGGVTWNRRAAVTTDFGATQVSLDNQGRALVVRKGKPTSLAAGQSMQLGRGESVTRNRDGSLIISDDNGAGGRVTTTLRGSGQGVDVSVDAQAVTLGGDLVRRT